MIAQKRVLSALLGLVFGLIPFQLAAAQSASGLDQVTSDALAAKAATVHQMRANMPSQAQREAAAAELRATKLRLEQARKAAVKAGIMTPEQAQIPVGVTPPGPGTTPDYFTTSNWAFSPELRKFVDALPGLTPAGANLLGNYIPVANPDSITYPGSDYYEIELIEFSHRFHTDLPATTRLRGYHQTNNGTDALGQNTIAPDPQARWLGPVIVANRDRPVRIKFTNRLPIGAGGDLVIPVDESILGSGKGPLWPAGALDPQGVPYPPGAVCDPTPVASIPPGNATPGQNCAKYTQNRSAIHLHGGRTPWISDGTPHQWIIPAGEWANTPYTEGVSLENVPDMPNPGPGSTTYYYSNQQSARLMFYHEHAWGITRLNVILGVAAGYLITDPFEQALVAQGALPADQIPLIIQDRSFIASDVRTNGDPTWNWGSGTPDQFGVRPVVVGDLWLPHVYVPAQNPYDPTGVNPFGRWVYGPWFFPATTNILYNTVPNPYHDPNCSDPNPAVFAFCTTPGQPPVIPGTPIPSVGAETFFDTAIVNGQAFPSLTVLPKAYRFRMLNAANDRFQNLNWYKADPAQVSRDGRTNTEVKMVPAALTAFDANLYPNWPVDGRVEGVPDPATQGPSWIHIGSEGGFTPRPTVVPPQPITFVGDPTAFNVGNVDTFGLFLGPAERADVVVDFSPYAGQTLILYNDAPAAVPAFDPRHDYLTGAPDMSDSGGYGRVPPGSLTGLKEGPQVGFGPNTRTVMQVNVANVAAAPAFDLAALEAAFAPAPGKAGVFETAQDGIIVGQDAYNGIYTGVTFPQVWPYWGFSRIQDVVLPVFTVGGTYQSFPMEPKGIHDEMGASFDMEYGRMAGNLGMTNPNPIVGLLNLTLYDYTDPATEILNNAITPLSPVLGDGTQIWKISHNGVDMHPIHFHIFDVQVVNRVGWDGQIRAPHPTELGWKDTVRISPLEDTIVAMRPWAPKLPFSVPNSLRPLNPAIPLNSPFGFTNIDPVTQQAKVPPDVNVVTNFGHEYVWHCHILSHEENDMMRPIILNVVSNLPGSPSPLTLSANAQGLPVLSWNDATPVDYVAQVNFGNPASEIAFRVEKSVGIAQPYTLVGFAPANTTTFTDTTYLAPAHAHYRVVAYNEGGAAVSNSVEFGTPEVFPPATSITLTSDIPSPYFRAIPASPVVFTAAALGGGAAGVGPYEFRFLIDRGAGFQVVQEYSASTTYTLPVTAPAGSFTVRADVRTASIDIQFISATMAYVITEPVKATVTLTADPLLPSPGYFGTPVTFTAVGAGSTGYQYRFTVVGNPVPVQDWSPVATWVLPATTLPGTHRVTVDVRTSGSGIDASAFVDYQVVYLPATAVSLVASSPSPHTLWLNAPTVTFLGTGSGSVGTPSTSYQYRFLLSSDGGITFNQVKAYSTARTWTLPAATPAGSYVVRVETRTSDHILTFDRFATLPFQLVAPAPATGVTLTASAASPQLPGTAVTYTAVGAGSANYQYRFWLSTNGVYAVAQDWSFLSTWTLPANAASAAYQVVVEVRTSSTTVPDATSATLPMFIGIPAATGVTLTPDLASPQIPGTAVVWTAAGQGSIAPYSYKFWLNVAGTWSVVQDWSPVATWTLANTAPAGTYLVQVEVRTTTGVVRDAISAAVSYTLAFPTFPPATGVTLTSDLSSPQAPGTAVLWTAAGQGSNATYSYRFWLNTAGLWSVVQDWSTAATWLMPTTTAAGSYQVTVEVRTSPSVIRDAISAFVPFVLTVPPPTPATGVTLAPSLASPQNVGTAVTWTAAGQGSTDPYAYRFWLSVNGVWAVVQDWSSLTTWTMAPSTAVGTYEVLVEVRTSTLVVRDAVSLTVPYVISSLVTPPATGVTMSPSVPSPQAIGATVVWTAAGQGSTAPYSYRFWFQSGGVWSMVQDWSAVATWTMPTTTAGGYQVAAEVRTTTTVARDAISPYVGFTISAPVTPPATGVTLTPDLASPQAAGTAVIWTAAGQGSTAPYSYRFWLNAGGVWSVAQDWSATATWTMGTATVPGAYLVTVEVRTTTNVSRDAVSANTPYTITAPVIPPATGVTLTPSLTSPQTVGTAVVWTAAGQGSTAAYAYRFWLNAGGVWTVAQDWSAVSTWTLAGTAAAGTYYLAVEVRTGSIGRDAVSAYIPFVISTPVTPPATGVTLTPSVASPVLAGTPVVFTAAGQGSTAAYSYRFWLNIGSIWTIVQDWNAAATWTLPGTVPAGYYQMVVEVRTSTTVTRDAVSPNVVYQVQ